MNNEQSNNNTPTSRAKKSLLPMTPLEEAFNLEISILRLLLKRHRAQHHRAHYFRHLTMTLRFVDRHNISSLSEVTRSTHIMKEERILEYERSMARKRRHRLQLSTKNDEEEDQWELNDSSNALKSWTGLHAPSPPTSFLLTHHEGSPTTPLKISRNKGNIKKNLEHSIAQHIQWLHCILTRYLPGLLHRIQKTFQILLQEVAKGYFLPFSSVAIGILARIRVIAMRWGREGVAEHMNVVSTLAQNSSLCVSDSFKKTVMDYCFVDSSIWMNAFIEIDPSWNPGSGNHKTKKRDDDLRHNSNGQTDQAKQEKILKETERSINEYGQKSQKDNNLKKNSPKFHIATNDDNDEDMGDVVHVNNFNQNDKSMKVIKSSLSSSTKSPLECVEVKSIQGSKTFYSNVIYRNEEGETAKVHDEKELKSNVNVKGKKIKSSKRKRPPSLENTMKNNSENNIKETLDDGNKNDTTPDHFKDRKKKKKKKSDMTKKKRKKSKTTTKDIFDEIFDGR